jgi:hypothetical protein
MSRLSHSAVSTYKICPYLYSLKYIHKLKTITTKSSLLFGTAMDKALNELLLKKSDGVQTFIDAFSEHTLNGTKEVVCGNPLFVFSQTDFDHEIFSQDDLEFVGCASQGELKDLYTKYLADKKVNSITVDDMKNLNVIYWLSLKSKALLMLQAYSAQVMPLIKDVLDIQREIKIVNDTGDSIIGFVDLIAELQDGRRVIFDNKTSSEPYKEDSVRISDQLALYCFALENVFKTRHCGYIVMPKKIKKLRKNKVVTPYVDIQVIVEEMPQEMEDKVMSGFSETDALIKEEKFDKNMSGCYTYGKCEMFDFCHKNDNKGLIKVEYVDTIVE